MTSPLHLKLARERHDINACSAVSRYRLVAVAAITRQGPIDPAMRIKGEKRFFGHGVDGVGSCEGTDVEDIGGLWILSLPCSQRADAVDARHGPLIAASGRFPKDPCSFYRLAAKSRFRACRANYQVPCP